MPAAAEIVRIRGWLLDLPLVEPLVSRHGVSDTRPVGIIELTDEAGNRGWGELDAMPTAGYTPHGVADGFARLRSRGLGAADPQWPFVSAALDLAQRDLAGRHRNQSFAAGLNGGDPPRQTVTAGVAVGRHKSVDELVGRVGELVADGYGRVKLKIEPGWDAAPIAAVAESFGDLIVHVDANESYGSGAVDHLASLSDLVDGLVLEQPFSADDPASHRQLRQRGAIVALDEAAHLWAVDGWEEAADAVVIKPGRFGSWGEAHQMASNVAAAGMRTIPGGMLESGLGRRALASLAAVMPSGLPGDCSPAARWYQRDPWPTETVAPDGTLAVWVGPGVAPPPDDNTIDDLAVDYFESATPRRAL